MTSDAAHRYHQHGQADKKFAVKHLSEADSKKYSALFDNEVNALRKVQEFAVEGVVTLIEEGITLTQGRSIVLQ